MANPGKSRMEARETAKSRVSDAKAVLLEFFVVLQSTIFVNRQIGRLRIAQSPIPGRAVGSIYYRIET